VIATSSQDAAVRRGCEALVGVCANLSAGERALIVVDRTTREVGEALASVAQATGARVETAVIPELGFHGEEPAAEVGAAMAAADVVFAATNMSLAHSAACRAALAAGTRCLSLPDYSLSVLASPALLADFRALGEEAAMLAGALTRAKAVRIRAAGGTDLSCAVEGRSGNSAPGRCAGPGTLASPPDSEANIAPLEASGEGVIVVDGSIPAPGLGLLDHAIELTVRDGRVVDVGGGIEADRLRAMLDAAGDPEARTVAEIGVGLNPLASLSGVMLEDEGCRGTAHVGLGGNATIGGASQLAFHLDLVLREAVLEVDGAQLPLARTDVLG